MSAGQALRGRTGADLVGGPAGATRSRGAGVRVRTLANLGACAAAGRGSGKLPTGRGWRRRVIAIDQGKQTPGWGVPLLVVVNPAVVLSITVVVACKWTSGDAALRSMAGSVWLA